MENLTNIFKVLSDETRLRIINLIFQQDLCVCELVEILDLSQPKISKHIAKIRQVDLVNTERREQFIYYSFNKNNQEYKKLITDILSNIKENKTLQKDNIQLQSIESFVCNT